MYNGERFNSITHLVGTILAFVGFGGLLTIAFQEYNWRIISSFTVFGITLTLLYSMSTLYHSIQSVQLKNLFQKFDHACIYLLIAGTYTPYMMLSLKNDGGMIMLLLIWSLAVVGLSIDVLVKKRIVWLQILIYLSMGWICIFKFSELKNVLPAEGFNWLIIGGVAYTVGVVFYILDKKNKLNHAHGIWHLFVLAGSISQFISIVFYVR